MHDPRFDEPLSDAALERAIEQALAVDPSPTFVARVRARCEREATRTHAVWAGTWSHWLGGLVVASVVVLAVAWVVDADRARMGDASAQPGDRRLVVAQGADHIGSNERGQSRERGAVEPHRSPPRRDRASGAVVNPIEPASAPGPVFVNVEVEPLVVPEVMLARDEQSVLVRLLGQGSPETVHHAPPLPELGEIRMALIVIEPLAKVARLEGDVP